MHLLLLPCLAMLCLAMKFAALHALPPIFFIRRKVHYIVEKKKYQSILGIIVDHLFEMMIEKKVSWFLFAVKEIDHAIFDNSKEKKQVFVYIDDLIPFLEKNPETFFENEGEKQNSWLIIIN